MIFELIFRRIISNKILTCAFHPQEYWSEVASLRQELFDCKLRNSDLPPASSFLSHSTQDAVTSQRDPVPPLPLPQPLISRETEPGRLDSVAQPNRIRETLSEYRKERSSSLFTIPLLGDHKLTQKQKIKQRRILTDPSTLEDALQISSRLKSVMVADELTKSDELSEDEVVLISKKYVEKMEKRALDYSARIEACRRCLRSSQRKQSQCGGGPSWKDYRRKEKIARKEMRREKRRRRQKMKEITSDTKREVGNSIIQETSTESKSSIGKDSNPSQPQSDISSQESQFSGYQGQSNHDMRENHRASTDFRRGFNQKILRMDEALMQFTETQSTFCKQLRDNLGGSLEKRGQELGALSEQIAALVRTTTSQVAMIEKLASDQVYTGQTSIEKNLEKLQTLKEEQMRKIENFHKKIFLPAMVTLTSLLGEQASSVTNMGVDLITKVEMLQDSFLSFSTQQGDSLIKLSEGVNMFASKHGNLIMRSRDHAKHLHVNTENFIRELQTRMNNVVKELVLVRLQSQSFVAVNENTFHEISASLNKTETIVDVLSEDLGRRLEKAKKDEGEYRSEFRRETDLITGRAEAGISEMLVRNHAAMTQIGETELETRAFTNAAEAAWNEMYVNQETELRQEADMLANNLQSHNHHTQNILTGLQGTAGTHEQVLEQQRMDFQGFIKKRQDALDTQCSSISDWAFLMSSELRRRDEDLHRFLSEELPLSPASVQGVTNYDDFLVSRLPDGTLLYDSTPTHTFSSGRSSTSNLTEAGSREELSDTTENSMKNNSVALGTQENSLVPTSSRKDLSSLSPTQKALLFISSQEGLRSRTSSNSFQSENEQKKADDKSEYPPPLKVDHKVLEPPPLTQENDVKRTSEEDFNNDAVFQNDRISDFFSYLRNRCRNESSKCTHTELIAKAISENTNAQTIEQRYKNSQNTLWKEKKVLSKFPKFGVNKGIGIRNLLQIAWDDFSKGKNGKTSRQGESIDFYSPNRTNNSSRVVNTSAKNDQTNGTGHF